VSGNKSDISNQGIRLFLKKVGKFYDEARGFDAFTGTGAQKGKLIKIFDNACCYCGKNINKASQTMDHLIPINKDSLGLHA
jgi:hypothetical protein